MANIHKEILPGANKEQLGKYNSDFFLIENNQVMSPAKWSIDSLIDYSINNHHPYIEENGVLIYKLAQNVRYQHDRNQPELGKLGSSLFLFFHDLFNNLKRDKQIFFPGIRQFVKNRSCNAATSNSSLHFIANLTEVLKKDHDTADKNLTFWRKLTNNYLPPADACTSYKFLVEKMREFEDGLLEHFDFKENILFAATMDNVE